MRAFVSMRRFLTANAGLFQRVDRLEQQQVLTNERIDLVLDKIEELSPAVTTEQLFSSGCVWDAYTFVCDLVPLFNRNSQSVGTARNTCLRIKMEAAKYRISQKIIQRIKQFLV